MKPQPLHPAIAHLNQDELNELKDKYLSGVKAIDLIRYYKIDVPANRLRKILPPTVLDQICTVCGAVVVQEVPARAGKRIIAGKVVCSICGHEESHSCRCQQCVAEHFRRAAEARAKRQTEIANAVAAEQTGNLHASCSLTDISLEVAVAFHALIRCCPIDARCICGPLTASPVPYAPTVALRNELLDLLRQTGLIAVSEQSAEGTIGFDGEQIVYDAKNVRWTVLPDDAQELIEKIELAGLTGMWPEHWYSKTESFWQKVALSECRQFYDYCAEKRGLQAQGDGAVNTMLTNLLRDFSVGQAYRIIWSGARAASDFLITKKPNRAHAANYMVGASQRWADQARAEGWEVTAFKRNFDLPRSMLSYVLFDVMLKIGERGFTDVICQESVHLA